jgi:signal transduction histidine kinase
VELGPSDRRWISLHKTTPTDPNQDTLVLVEDISDMERLQDELLHSERLASIGRLAAGVAHEIGNPVTGISSLAQNLAYIDDPQEIRDTSEDILKQTDRVTRIVESLVNFSHVGLGAGSNELEPCNVADCVDEAIHLLQLDIQAKDVAYNNRCDRELLVSADSQRLLQVFVNLLSNARDASPDGARILIDADIVGGQAEIAVEDRGCGVPAELQDEIFEPFVTTKDPGQGTGLGLALVYSIMEDMHGSVALKSPLVEGDSPGTRFTLRLPVGDYGNTFDL